MRQKLQQLREEAAKNLTAKYEWYLDVPGRGRFIVRTMAWHNRPVIPKVEPPKPGTTVEAHFNRFNKLNRGSDPLLQKFVRTASYVVAPYRIFVYAGGYYITVTRNTEEDKHLVVLYLAQRDKRNEVLASMMMHEDFFRGDEIKKKLFTAIMLRKLKVVDPYRHIPYT